MKPWLLDILRCPKCKSKLKASKKGEIENGFLSCTNCSSRYEVKQGIPIFESTSEYALRSSQTKIDDQTKEVIESILPNSSYPKPFVRKKAYYIYDTFVFDGERYHYLRKGKGINKAWLRGNIDAQVGTDILVQRYKKLFPEAKNKICFDIACGCGLISSAMAKLGCKVIGLDADFKALLLAKERAKHDKVDVQLIKGDAQNLPFVDSFADLGLTIETIEHTPNQEKVLLEMWRLMKPGGLFYVHTPNKSFPLDAHDSGIFFIHWLPYNLSNLIAKRLGRANLVYNPEKKHLEWGLNKYFTSTRVLKILKNPKVVNEFFPEYNPNKIKNSLIRLINFLSRLTGKPKTAFTGCIDLVVQKPYSVKG